MPSTHAHAFDEAFSPLSDDRIDRLARLFTTVTTNGCVVQLKSDYLGVVNGGIVTDYDCHFCGDVGRHRHEFCRHQEALLEAMEEQQAQEDAREIRDLQMTAVGR